jgi:hypothetical protein
MLKKLSLIGAAVAASAVTLIPTAPAMAQGYYGDRYDYGDRYERQYRGDRYDRQYRGNDRRYYNNNRRYNYRQRYNRRCNDGTTGTIVGAIAGGLLGHEIVGRRGDRTAGTIIGGAVGALGGRAIERGGNPRYCR